MPFRPNPDKLTVSGLSGESWRTKTSGPVCSDDNEFRTVYFTFAELEACSPFSRGDGPGAGRSDEASAPGAGSGSSAGPHRGVRLSEASITAESQSRANQTACRGTDARAGADAMQSSRCYARQRVRSRRLRSGLAPALPVPARLVPSYQLPVVSHE
jgi:hypothetical protein